MSIIIEIIQKCFIAYNDECQFEKMLVWLLTVELFRRPTTQVCAETSKLNANAE